MADGTAPHGRNDVELTDAERSALFHEHFKPLCEIDDQIAALNEQKKKRKRLAKNDGFASDDLSWALRARKMEDTGLVVDALKRRFEIAGWLHFMPPGFQMDLFSEDNRTEEERAYGKGAVAASFNRKPSPEVDGYQTGSVEGQAWLRGYNAEGADRAEHLASGRAKLAEQMQAEAAAAPQEEPKKRGRPKKSQSSVEGTLTEEAATA